MASCGSDKSLPAALAWLPGSQDDAVAPEVLLCCLLSPTRPQPQTIIPAAEAPAQFLETFT